MNEVAEKGAVTADILAALGFDAMAQKIREKKEFKRKMALAYEHYRCVTEEKLIAFMDKLQNETMKTDKFGHATWNTLDFTSVRGYEGIPPADVLAKMQEAKDLKCFDEFQVASIRHVKDPILFGRINNCRDYFYIAHWDDDVKIQDILKDNEG